MFPRSNANRPVGSTPKPHQLSNNGTDDFAYYVIADNPRHDSCYYPDSGKWAVSKESPDYIIVQGTETDYYKDEE